METAFENDRPVLVEKFRYPEDEADHDPHVPNDAFDVLRDGIIVALAGRTAEAVRIRLGAVARLAGIFASDSEAARRLCIHRTSMSRAVQKVRSELRRAAKREAHQAKQEKSQQNQ